METEIQILVRNRVPTIVNIREIITYNTDYTVRFDFDGEWDEFEHKTVYFVDETGNYTAVISSDDKCEFPLFENERRRIFIGVQAGELKTTRPCYVNVLDSIADMLNSPIPPPTDDVYAQIMNIINSLESAKLNPVEKTADMTQPVGRDENGLLYTAPSSGESGSGELWYPTVTDGVISWTKSASETAPEPADIQGLPGADGKSAYEYAQEGGYTGTEEEFSAKLAAEIPEVDDSLTQSGQAADAKATGDALRSLSEEKVDNPSTAEVGQTIVVKAVDDTGKPTEWEAVDGRSDWSENDEAASGYVKNRPFWAGDTEEKLLLDETEITFGEYGDAAFEVPLQLTEGNTYIVTYNGVVYECVAYRDNWGTLNVGNGTLWGSGGGNGEPFVFDGEWIQSTDTSALIKIVEIHKEIHKIDKDYLPSTIPFMVDGKIPKSFVQEQFPIVGSVFGGTITNNTSTQSTRQNPYPNKKELSNLTIETFNAMLDGNQPLPIGFTTGRAIATLAIDYDNRQIVANWFIAETYFSSSYPIAGARVEVYKALIHEDTDNPGTIVSEYAYIILTDKALS